MAMKCRPLRLVDVVGLHDVRVIEARCHARLFEEHGEELFILDEIGAQLFERDQLGEAGRTLRGGHVDDTHAAAGHFPEEPVAPYDVAERMIHMRHEHPLLLVGQRNNKDITHSQSIDFNNVF